MTEFNSDKCPWCGCGTIVTGGRNANTYCPGCGARVIMNGIDPEWSPAKFDLCAACLEPFTVDEWAERHTDDAGNDIHAHCCEACA